MLTLKPILRTQSRARHAGLVRAIQRYRRAARVHKRLLADDQAREEEGFIPDDFADSDRAGAAAFRARDAVVEAVRHICGRIRPSPFGDGSEAAPQAVVVETGRGPTLVIVTEPGGEDENLALLPLADVVDLR
jgi:hypothetical protein